MNATKRVGDRWKLIGNAVSVPMAKWVGTRLSNPGYFDPSQDTLIAPNAKWPTAAWGENGVRYRVDISEWPKCYNYTALADFLKFPTNALSLRATSGFYGRLGRSSLHRPVAFDKALESHVERMTEANCPVASI